MVNWARLNFNARDIITLIIFTFSMSGIYYKLFYASDLQKADLEAFKKVTDARLSQLENNQKESWETAKQERQLIKIQLQMLLDDYNARKAVEEYKRAK